MKKIRLTNNEIEALRLAVRYYRDLATHPKKNDENSPGLPPGKENDLLTSVLIKLENLE